MPDPPVSVRIRSAGPEDGEAIARLLAGQRSAGEVSCVIEAPDGTPEATSWVEPADVELVGGQRLALYATVPATLPSGQADALLSETYRVLDEAFDPEDADGPIGLCLLISDRGEMKRRPEASWADPPMLYVGYLSDGRQVRVGYFHDAQLRGET